MSLLPFSGPVIPVPVPISKGGTGSATQNFVDLSSTQSSIGGAKTFTSAGSFSSTLNVGSTLTTRGVQPASNVTYSAGTSSLYYSNLYSQVVNLNSTASLSGSTAGQITTNALSYIVNTSGSNALHIDTTGNLLGDSQYLTFVNLRGRMGYNNGHIIIDDGANNGSGTTASKDLQIWLNGMNSLMQNSTGTSLGVTAGGTSTLVSPTHTLTLNSTATGIAYYNTVDQTTNYERVLGSWVSNVFTIQTQNGGTGVRRSLSLSGANNVSLTLGQGVPFLTMTNTSTSNNTVDSWYKFTATGMTASSGTQNLFLIAPTINQSGTAGYTVLFVNPTETATGSGTKRLLDLQVGGVDKFNVDNTGHLSLQTGNSNSSIGTGTLSGGTVTISTTAVTSSSIVFITDTSNGANIGTLSVGTITAGTSFVVNSSNVLDSSTFNWIVIN